MRRPGDGLQGLAGPAGQRQYSDDGQQAERGRGAGRANLAAHMTLPGPRFEVPARGARDDPGGHGEYQRDDGAPRPGSRLHLGHLLRHLKLALFAQVHRSPSVVSGRRPDHATQEEAKDPGGGAPRDPLWTSRQVVVLAPNGLPAGRNGAPRMPLTTPKTLRLRNSHRPAGNWATPP